MGARSSLASCARLLKDATLHDELHERCFGDDHERRLQQNDRRRIVQKNGGGLPRRRKFDATTQAIGLRPVHVRRRDAHFRLILFIGASFHKCWCFAKETRTAYSDANFGNRKIKALRMTISVLDERALLGGSARYIRYTTWASLEDIAHFEGLFARVDSKVNHDAISNLKSLSTIYNLKSLAPLSNVLGIPGVNVPVPTAATNEPTTGV